MRDKCGKYNDQNIYFGNSQQKPGEQYPKHPFERKTFTEEFKPMIDQKAHREHDQAFLQNPRTPEQNGRKKKNDKVQFIFFISEIMMKGFVNPHQASKRKKTHEDRMHMKI